MRKANSNDIFASHKLKHQSVNQEWMSVWDCEIEKVKEEENYVDVE